MPPALVLGLGNPLSGADAFGPAVLDRLRAGGGKESLELVDAGTDLLASMDRFADHEQIVLVDAVLASGDTGVAVYTEAQFSTWDDRSRGAHALSPLMVVKLFRAMVAGSEGRDPHGPPARPRITLIAYLVDEAAFGRPPDADTIAAGVAAVQEVAGRSL